MVEVIIDHKVKDFDAWLPVFRDHDKVRREFGCEGATVHRTKNDPNEVIIRFEWSRPDRFQEFVERSDLKEVMKKAGVIGEPRMMVLGDAVPWRG